MGWKKDKTWSDPYLLIVKAICGLLFIGEASEDEDRERNTDLTVFSVGGVRIAVRIRRHEYWLHTKPDNYRKEFTIRYSRPNGRKTEYQKILDGWGDFLFYGFALPKPPHLHGWGIVDLSLFRVWATIYRNEHGRDPGHKIQNVDKTQGRAFYWSEIPQIAILATYSQSVANGIAHVPPEFREAVQLALEYTRS